MLVATLYAPLVLILSYFLDPFKTGSILLFLSAVHITILLAYRSSKNRFYLPITILFCSICSLLFQNIKHLQLAPLLISLGFLGIFVLYSVQKKSIPLEATVRFRKKEISKSEREFLTSSHNWWIITLLLNIILHIYFISQDDISLWALYSSLGWYCLFGVSLALNIIIGKLVVQKNSL
jgi:uncharacterized membrane protein